MATTVEVQRAVRESDLPAPARLIVLTLAVLADHKTGAIPERFTPSLTELAEQTGLNRATVQRHLRVLEATGWVLRDRPDIADARSQGAKTTYRLAVGGRCTAPLGAQGTQQGRCTEHLAVGAECASGRCTVHPIKRKTPTGSTEPSTNHGQPARERAPAKPKAKSQRGTRIPDDFAVTADMAQWVVDRFKNKINGRAETEKFVDHWLAASGQRAIKRDWVAAWRNWMRNAAEFAAARPNGNGTSAAYVEPRERRCPIHPGHLEATCRPCEAEHRAREPPQLGAFDPYPPHPNGAS